MRIVITGGPGFGKTSIIKELQKKYPVVGESSRDLINELKNKEGIDPRKNRERFQLLVTKKRIQDYINNNQEIIFFDRGVNDEIAYYLFYNIKPTKECINFCKKNKYDYVFIVPEWKEIHEHDDLRKESFEEAVKLHNLIINAYKDFGHNIIEIPKLSIKDRSNFVIQKINEKK
jgi:predicted ATPase